MASFIRVFRKFDRNSALKWGDALPEILVVLLWSVWVSRSFLGIKLDRWPEGGEFTFTIQSHYMWEAFNHCGLCFLWNGGTNGGIPAFAETHGAPFHPLVMIPTVFLGVIGGMKVILPLIFFMAGAAQLWLGRLLGLRWLPRVWCAMLAVVGGHLSGRMEGGLVVLVLSLAACSLFIPAYLQFLLRPTRGNTVLLGVVSALAVLSGQGYFQIGMVLSLIPAFLFLVLSPSVRKAFPWPRLGFALLLTVLFAAFFLIPLAHFLPLMGKAVDPDFTSAQPIAYAPLNLVIDDFAFFKSDALQKSSYGWMNAMFIGWIPVVLAVLALGAAPPEKKKIVYAFAGSIILVYLCAAAVTLRILGSVSMDLASLLRTPSLIAGLAVPLILGMAGLGLQWLLERPWLRLQLVLKPPSGEIFRAALNFALLLAAVLCFFSLRSAYNFSEEYLKIIPFTGDMDAVLQTMATDELEWVQPPPGENIWVAYREDRNLKFASINRAWWWINRDTPKPRLYATHEQDPERTPVAVIDDTYIYLDPDVHYASIATASGGVVPCSARGRWGDLDVTCESEEGGVLTLQENSWDGWQAALDGNPAPIIPGTTLAVAVPAGRHEVSFRYRPWDVALGAGLTVFGVVLAAVYLWTGRRKGSADPAAGG
jgi:hypothetical protein